MSRRRLVAALLCLLITGALFWSLRRVLVYAIDQFLQGEPALISPIQTPDGVLRVRTDRNGKGYFGANRDGGRKHKGVDLLSAVGDPVFAAKSGRVIFAGWQKGYGGVVKVAHPNQTVSVYAHLSRLFVNQGEWVSQSTQIGRVGKSGNSSPAGTLPHLHFELRQNGVVIDPSKALRVSKLSISL